MKLAFEVDGLPPKKDGANSMWGKGVAREPLKLLREGALEALQGGGSRLTKNIRLTLRVHVGPQNNRQIGDLDNMVSGVLDGLQLADGRAKLEAWPIGSAIDPREFAVLSDDVEIVEIRATKIVKAEAKAPWYRVELEGA